MEYGPMIGNKLASVPEIRTTYLTPLLGLDAQRMKIPPPFAGTLAFETGRPP